VAAIAPTKARTTAHQGNRVSFDGTH
jgi:hypothetical protein